jgi:hypothetical protein
MMRLGIEREDEKKQKRLQNEADLQKQREIEYKLTHEENLINYNNK